LAAAQNGDVVEAFTSATISDNAAHTDTADFVLLPDRPSYWSPFDPDPANPYVSVAGVAESDTTFTGDSVEIRLAGANEYLNNNAEFARTVLAGVIIDYVSIVTPGIPGDFNMDTKVNAADYVLWRKNPAAFLPADYNTWRANFGVGGGSGSSVGTSQVPEPGFCAIAAVLAVVFLGRRRQLKMC
jgi:hypothetical protein